MEKLELGNFDSKVAGINLVYGYYFSGSIEKESLQKSLDVLISKYFPFLGFKLVVDKDRTQSEKIQKLKLIPSGQKVEIIEKNVYEMDQVKNFDFCELNKPKGKFNEISLKEHQSLKSLFENINVKDPFLEDSSIFKVTLLNYKDKKANDIKSILCISINHCVADANSICFLINTWEKIFNQKESEIPKYVFDRDMLCKAEEKVKVLKPEYLKKYGMFNDASKGKLWFAFSKVYALTELKFTKKSIDEIKERVYKLNGGKLKISTNDIICAHFWKVKAIIRDNLNTTIYPLTTLINFRRLIGENLKYYFGNAVTPVIIETLTRGDLLKKSIEELALIVRKSINEFEKQDVQNIYDELEKSKLPLNKVEYDFINGTTVNDWRQINLSLPTFGTVKAERVVAPGDFILPYFIFLKSKKNDDSTYCHVPFEMNFFRRMKKLELTSPKIYPKLVEMYCKKIQINSEVFEKYKEFKKEKIKFFICKINFKAHEIVVCDVGDNTKGWNDVLDLLPEKDEGRFIYFNIKYKNKSGNERKKMIYVYFMPDKAPVKRRMIYVNHHAVLKKDCHFQLFFQAQEKDDILYDDIVKKCISKFD